MAARSVALIGSTGSIGRSTLDVVRAHPDRFRIVSLAAGDNVEELARQVAEFRPLVASVRTEAGLAELRRRLAPGVPTHLVCGPSGAERAAAIEEADVTVAAFVGAAGLAPTIAAVRAGKTVALANKESLVVAGAFVSQLAREYRARLLPVDSEHSAIFQALAGAPVEQVRRLILTASGGPFFLRPEVELSKVTPEEALAHPNWKMGAKITIDSATMMNKGLEVIEAHWLFGLPAPRIDVVVHPQSIVHSMVEYVDGSVMAQLGVPDMKGPIAYALAYPDRLPGVMKPLDFAALRELSFFAPDPSRFPGPEIAREALERGETYPAVLNGANEVTVEAFLSGKIRFTDILRINRSVMEAHRQRAFGDLSDYVAADREGREGAREAIGR